MALFSLLILLWMSDLSLVLGVNQDNKNNILKLEYQKCKTIQRDSGKLNQKLALAVFEDQHVRSVHES